MVYQLHKSLGGSLRPADPRRFLVEAMIGAMQSDGHVDPRELEVLHYHLAEHELFARLPRDAAHVLVEMATDAVQHASDGRVRAIARGLPTRTHRLAAYAMACEICEADDRLHEREVQYLHNLQRWLQLADDEAGELFQAARKRRAMAVLADHFIRMRYLMPRVVDCFALQHCLERRVLERHKRRLFDFLIRLVDMHASEDDIWDEIERALAPLEHSQNVAYSMRRLASAVSRPSDRYWMTVYIAAGYRYRSIEDWPLKPFNELLCTSFGIEKLDTVSEHAALIIEPRAPGRDRLLHRQPRRPS